MRNFLRVVRYYRMRATERREAWARGPRWVGVLPLISLTTTLLMLANAGDLVTFAIHASNPRVVFTSAYLRNILLLGALSTLEVVGSLLIARWLTPRRMIVGANALREAVRRGDEHLAPVVLRQAQRLDAEKLSQGAALGPFLPPTDGRADEETLRAEALLIVAALATGTAIYLTVLVGWSGWSRAAIVGLAALSVVLLIDGVWVIVRARRFSGPVNVVILPNGLSWRYGKRHAQNILWSQACGFAGLGYRYGTDGKQHCIYLLDASDDALAWELPADADHEMSEESELLRQVICARTGLPLRDISMSVAALATRARSRGTQIAGTDDAATLVVTPGERRRVNGAFALALTPLLLAAVMSGVALALSRLL